jgi:hypothetical protein
MHRFKYYSSLSFIAITIIVSNTIASYDASTFGIDNYK